MSATLITDDGGTLHVKCDQCEQIIAASNTQWNVISLIAELSNHVCTSSEAYRLGCSDGYQEGYSDGYQEGHAQDT